MPCNTWDSEPDRTGCATQNGGRRGPRPTQCRARRALLVECGKATPCGAIHRQPLAPGADTAHLTAGLGILDNPAAVFDSATAELQIEPTSARDKVIKYAALHMDRHGRDPLDHDPTFAAELTTKVKEFRSALVRRSQEGWTTNVVVSAHNLDRLESITEMVDSIDGPNVEIFAYPYSLPLVMSTLIISNRSLLVSHDHRRWERPGAGMLIRSRSAAAWADNYFSELVADAPFRLRTPSGINRAELDRFAQTLTNTSDV